MVTDVGHELIFKRHICTYSLSVTGIGVSRNLIGCFLKIIGHQGVNNV